MEPRSRTSFTIILALALNMMLIGQSVAFDISTTEEATGGAPWQCAVDYFQINSPDAWGGPLLTPGDYILWYAAAYTASWNAYGSNWAPCEKWVWNRYNDGKPVTLRAGGKYLVEWTSPGVCGFTTNIPPMETLESYPNMAKVWHQNRYDRKYPFAYFFQGPIGTGGSGEGEVVEWPVTAGGNGHYYEVVFVPSGITAPEAKAAAEAKNGHLVTITSAGEDDFVYSLCSDDKFWYKESEWDLAGPWIGGYLLPDSSEFAWFTGEPFSYTNWHPEDPDPYPTNDRMMYVGHYTGKPTKTWGNVPPDWRSNSYIVEWEGSYSQ